MMCVCAGRWDYKLEELNKNLKKVLSGLSWNAWKIGAHLLPLAPILEDKILEDSGRVLTWAGPASKRHVNTSSAEAEMLRRLMKPRWLCPKPGREGETFLGEKLLPASAGFLDTGTSRVRDVVKQAQQTRLNGAPWVHVSHKQVSFTAGEVAKRERKSKAAQALSGLSSKQLQRELAACEMYFPEEQDEPAGGGGGAVGLGNE